MASAVNWYPDVNTNTEATTITFPNYVRLRPGTIHMGLPTFTIHDMMA